MGIICLYVLIQKSGQKTAKSHLCAMGGSFWQKEGLLQLTMTLLQDPKDPVLPSLIYTLHELHT